MNLSPLFFDQDKGILTRGQFIGYLRHILSTIGLDVSKFCGHSFRIGAATSAAAIGIEDHMIQNLGRWSSNCYTRYIRIAKKDIQQAQVSMTHT